MRMSEKCHNKSDNLLTSRRTDGCKKIAMTCISLFRYYCIYHALSKSQRWSDIEFNFSHLLIPAFIYEHYTTTSL